MILFEGAGVAITTPFKTDNEKSVDFDQLGKNIEFQIENGTSAIIVVGTTGEASTMTEREKLDTIEFTVNKVAKRVPVIAGTGSNNTLAAVDMSVKAEKLGVDGILVVTPYYNKTSQRGLIEHYKTINDSVSLPMMLYTVPGRTGMSIAIDTLSEISKLKNVAAIKDAEGNISKTLDIYRTLGDRLTIYSGNDDLIVPTLSVGGKGVVSVLSNVIPKETDQMCKDFLSGNYKSALEIQAKYKRLIDLLFIETNPIMPKYALKLMGRDSGVLRLPLVEPSDEHKKMLEAEMAKLYLI